VKALSSWRLWMFVSGAAIMLAFAIARRDRIAKVFVHDKNSSTESTSLAEAEQPALRDTEDRPSNLSAGPSGPQEAPTSADPEATHKVLSPDEEVKSWGPPILEGELRIEDSRLARQAIYRTQLKYPLIMVQQIWQISETDPKVKDYVGERKMVADHLVVRLRDVKDLEIFQQKIAREGMSLRKQMYAGGLYLVSFPIGDIGTYQLIQQRLMALPEVKSVTPDIYGRGF
jgi:hypothetical protein